MRRRVLVQLIVSLVIVSAVLVLTCPSTVAAGTREAEPQTRVGSLVFALTVAALVTIAAIIAWNARRTRR